MRAWLIAAVMLAAGCRSKNPKLTPEWKAALVQLAPDCGDELGDNGSWSCKGKDLRMLLMIQDGRLEHVTVWIGTHDGAEAALKRVEMFSALVRPEVWIGVRAHINDSTSPTAASFHNDGSPPERYSSGITTEAPIREGRDFDPMPTYFVSLSWDD